MQQIYIFLALPFFYYYFQNGNYLVKHQWWQRQLCTRTWFRNPLPVMIEVSFSSRHGSGTGLWLQNPGCVARGVWNVGYMAYACRTRPPSRHVTLASSKAILLDNGVPSQRLHCCLTR